VVANTAKGEKKDKSRKMPVYRVNPLPRSFTTEREVAEKERGKYMEAS
jgi:hypothetical protein